MLKSVTACKVGTTYVVRTWTEKSIRHTVCPTKQDARKLAAKILIAAKVKTVCTILQPIEYVRKDA